MPHKHWKIYTGIVFIGLSLVLGLVHWAIFHQTRDLIFYLALDVVFVPIQVLFVTIILEKLWSEHEKEAMLKKLNMVIGAFFSEVGAKMLRSVVSFSTNRVELAKIYDINANWKDSDFKRATAAALNGQYSLTPSSENLIEMRKFLVEKRIFVLGMLQNANLLEHDTFSNLLWAVTHLSEELEARNSLESLPKSDVEHLTGDVKRAFGLLIAEWLAYMAHLKTDYPYIFSLSVRNNPFNPKPDPVVKS